MKRMIAVEAHQLKLLVTQVLRIIADRGNEEDKGLCDELEENFGARIDKLAEGSAEVPRATSIHTILTHVGIGVVERRERNEPQDREKLDQAREELREVVRRLRDGPNMTVPEFHRNTEESLHSLLVE